MAPTETVEAPAVVRFFNEKAPFIKFLVKRDPQSHVNPTLGQDVYLEFVAGQASSADPDVIAWADGPVGRAKGCRRFDSIEDVAELNGADPATLEELVKRRMAELGVDEKAIEALKKGRSGAGGIAGRSEEKPA